MKHSAKPLFRASKALLVTPAPARVDVLLAPAATAQAPPFDHGTDTLMSEIACAFALKTAAWPRDVKQRFGSASANAHWGEVFQGALSFGSERGGAEHALRSRLPQIYRHLTAKAPVPPLPDRATRCLVDLPCPALLSRASVVLRRSQTRYIEVSPAGCQKAARACAAVLDLLGVRDVQATLHIVSTIPAGKGLGSSSADIVATSRATAAALGVSLHQDVLGLLLCCSEAASNPVHLDTAALFAHRRGIVLRYLGAWPAAQVLGFDVGGAIDSEAFVPVRYGRDDLRAHAVQIEALAHAFRSGDLGILAAVAGATARHDRRLPHNHALLHELVRDFRASGYVCAHSGTVSALLWPPGDEASLRRCAAARALTRAGHPTWSWNL